MAAPNPMLDAVAGNAEYARNIVKMNDTADPVTLIRNAWNRDLATEFMASDDASDSWHNTGRK